MSSQVENTEGILRTSGTVIGEILYKSRISLHDGMYIFGGDFVTQMMDNGLRSDENTFLRHIGQSPSYGRHDNILTRVQFLFKAPRYLSTFAKDSSFTHNQWKEITTGVNGHFIPYEGVGLGEGIKDVHATTLISPRKGVERLKAMYEVFASLPTKYQEDFLDQVNSHSCDLEYQTIFGSREMRIQQYPIMNAFIDEMVQSVHVSDRSDLTGVLNLLAIHNFCVEKGPIVRSEIKSLLGYDTSKIPDQWKPGTLDERVIKGSIDELTEMLSRPLYI